MSCRSATYLLYTSRTYLKSPDLIAVRVQLRDQEELLSFIAAKITREHHRPTWTYRNAVRLIVVSNLALSEKSRFFFLSEGGTHDERFRLQCAVPRYRPTPDHQQAKKEEQ